MKIYSYFFKALRQKALGGIWGAPPGLQVFTPRHAPQGRGWWEGGGGANRAKPHTWKGDSWETSHRRHARSSQIWKLPRLPLCHQLGSRGWTACPPPRRREKGQAGQEGVGTGSAQAEGGLHATQDGTRRGCRGATSAPRAPRHLSCQLGGSGGRLVSTSGAVADNHRIWRLHLVSESKRVKQRLNASAYRSHFVTFSPGLADGCNFS